jgi:hypothetical protein
MHITKLNNYKMDEKKKNNTPIKNTCLLHVLLKIYKDNIPMLEHCAQQLIKINKEGNYIQVTQSKHHLDIMHN